MVRLSRAQQQERTRAAVIAAAHEEFAVHGYADARIDRIAERSGFTRGALYANFPSKRALYLAVLLDLERGEDTAAMEGGDDLADLIEAFARVRLERLPLTTDSPPAAHLRLRSLSGVFDTTTPRRPSPDPDRSAPTTTGVAIPAARLGDGPLGHRDAARQSSARPDGGPAEEHAATRERPAAPDSRDAATAERAADGGPAGEGDAATEEPAADGGPAGEGDAATAERAALAGVARLEGLLLGLALETRAPGRRLVRLADVVRTLLDGACHRAEIAPGVGDPFDVVRACRQLASLDLGEVWEPPHRAFVRPAIGTTAVWEPPAPVTDLVGGGTVDLGRWDGLVMVLGTGRLGAAEEAVRSGEPVALVVVTERPAELGALVRLRVADTAGCLRRLGMPGSEVPFRVVVDEDGSVAGRLGVAARDQAEVAVRVSGRHVLARADGRGAALAVADVRGAR